MRQINANDCESILLGRQGENLATKVIFDISEWKTIYGNGTAQLIYRAPSSMSSSGVHVTTDGDYVFWDVTSEYTEIASGCGECELQYYSGNALVKSRTWITFVDAAMSVPEGATPPQPEQSWVDGVVEVGAAAKVFADTAKSYAERAETAAINQPMPDTTTHTWWVWDTETAAYADTGVSCGDAYLHPGEKTDAMTLGVGVDTGGKLFAEKDPDVVKMSNNYGSGSGTSIAVTGAGVSPLKSLVVTANTDMPNNGNPDDPASLGYSSGIRVTYPDGTVDELEPASKLYAIKGPWSADFARNKRDWTRKKDTNKVFHYVFTGDEAFLEHSVSHMFSLPMYAMTDFPVPTNTTAKRLTVCSHYKGETFGKMNSLLNAEDSSSVDGMVSVYGWWNTTTLEVTNKTILFCDSRFSTREEFKAYLKQQFNDGTPVEIAYIVGFEYETDIPEADYQLYKNFALRSGDCTITSKDGCGLECEWWKNFAVKNYIDWADKLFSGGSENDISYVTPESYGAVGDGVADDTGCLQAALDSGKLVIMSKSYRTTAALQVKGNTKIFAPCKIISSADTAIQIYGQNVFLYGGLEVYCKNGVLIGGGIAASCIKLQDVYIYFTDTYGVKLDADVKSVFNNDFSNMRCYYMPHKENQPNDQWEACASYGFWLYKNQRENYTFCNHNAFHHCIANDCGIGAYLQNYDNFDPQHATNPMNDNAFYNFSPEGSNVAVRLKGYVSDSNFTNLRTEDCKDRETIQLFGFSKANRFQSTNVLCADKIVGREYQFDPANSSYSWGASDLYLNYFDGQLITNSAGGVHQFCQYQIASDLKGGTILVPLSPKFDGIYRLPASGNDGMDTYLTGNQEKTWAINYDTFCTAAAHTGESPVLHLTNEIWWPIKIIVEPGLSPIIVKDPDENVVFSLSEPPAEKAIYTLHIAMRGKVEYITKDTLFDAAANNGTTA